MDRETKTIVTPGNNTVVLKAYLTGRESQDLKSVIFSSLKMNMEDATSGKVTVPDVPGTFLLEQEKKALSLLLVSINGSTENPVEKLLDLPSTEYDSVIAEVNQITNPTKPRK